MSLLDQRQLVLRKGVTRGLPTWPWTLPACSAGSWLLTFVVLSYHLVPKDSQWHNSLRQHGHDKPFSSHTVVSMTVMVLNICLRAWLFLWFWVSGAEGVEMLVLTTKWCPSYRNSHLSTEVGFKNSSFFFPEIRVDDNHLQSCTICYLWRLHPVLRGFEWSASLRCVCTAAVVR